MQATLARFRSADWRLRLYTLLVPVFWLLALGPGWGREAGLEMDWEWALINCLLLVPLLRRRSMWPVTLLGIFSMWVTIAMWMTVITGNNGLHPWDPASVALALVAGTQFLLLLTYDLDDENAGKGAPVPLQGPGAPGGT